MLPLISFSNFSSRILIWRTTGKSFSVIQLVRPKKNAAGLKGVDIFSLSRHIQASLYRMSDYLPISEEAILKLLQGDSVEQEAALVILFNRLARPLAAYALSILPPALSGDCQDVVSEAFSALIKNRSSGVSSVESYLKTIVRNNALSRCRKQEVRDRPITDPQDLERLIPREVDAPDQIVVAKENEQGHVDVANAVFEALDAVAAGMGLKEKEVAHIMLRIIRNTARWPTAGRIYDELKKTDKALKEGTVKDRRKEVMKKFNPILNSYGRTLIGD